MTDSVLSGTQPLQNNATSHSFTDAYPKQWAATLEWMKAELIRAESRRNRERRRDSEWVTERRAQLQRTTGASRYEAVIETCTIIPNESGFSDGDCRLYQLSLSNGLELTGVVALPSGTVGGVVLIADPQIDLLNGDDRSFFSKGIGAYLERDLAVVQPFFAQNRSSFADDEVRHWYAFEDPELIHLFSFIAGGSLVGFEAMELVAAATSLDPLLGRTERETELPRYLHLRGRHVLAGTVAAALFPGLFDTLIFGDGIDRLDHQEEETRANTIWSFHRDFDALTLLQLAEGTDLLFLEEGPTPSAAFAKAQLWLTDRVVRRSPLAKGVAGFAGLLNDRSHVEGERTPASSEATRIERERADEATGPDALYLASLASKVTFLEKLHADAEKRLLTWRKEVDVDSPQYREDVKKRVDRVMGPPLPTVSDPRVRTARVEHDGPYALYQVQMESVPGVDTAGYLLVPHTEGPFPAVVCQHGLMGRPEDLLGERWVYYRIASLLAEKGYVVYVPFMNWGWGGTPSRDLLTKHAYALGITPNRFEVAQLGVIVDFLQDRSEVIADRIGFYGLSYGGHASLWLGACEPRLAAVVTAGHFNSWRKKLTSLDADAAPLRRRPTSYITVNEGIDMFSYDILNQFDHAELATLNAPRPYMVENGLKDTVSPKAWVEEEFERVAEVYAHLERSSDAALTHFDGPHRIWGEESLLFLHEHLR